MYVYIFVFLHTICTLQQHAFSRISPNMADRTTKIKAAFNQQIQFFLKLPVLRF